MSKEEFKFTIKFDVDEKEQLNTITASAKEIKKLNAANQHTLQNC